jgi:hypothetical protein
LLDPAHGFSVICHADTERAGQLDILDEAQVELVVILWPREKLAKLIVELLLQQEVRL